MTRTYNVTGDAPSHVVRRVMARSDATKVGRDDTLYRLTPRGVEDAIWEFEKMGYNVRIDEE